MLVLAANAAAVLYFWDRGWLPADDGYFAHVAERLLRGDVLQRDISEAHPGYVHWLNAFWLKLWGAKLSSLHIVPAIMAWTQAPIAYALVRRHGPWPALCAATAAAGIGFLQIVSPSPHLYCLFLVFLTALVLERTPAGRVYRTFLLGLYIGLMAGFRQPSGLYAGLGVIAYLCASGGSGAAAGTAGRIWLRACSVVLAIWMTLSTNVSGLCSSGIWAVAVLWLLAERSTVNARTLGRLLFTISLGIAAAWMPLLIYHLKSGSVLAALTGMGEAVRHVGALEHIKRADYSVYYLGAMKVWISGDGPMAKLNGLYWALLPALPAINGLLCVRRIREERPQALPILAVCFAPVSLFNQIPFYLYATSALTIVSILYQTAQLRRRAVLPVSLAALMMTAVAVYSHAGQPYTRSFAQMVSGIRMTMALPEKLTKAGIWMDEAEVRVYETLVQRLSSSPADERPLLVFPNNAEVYFLSGRPNLFRSWNPAIDIADETALGKFLEAFDREAPPTVVIARDTVYTTAWTERLRKAIALRGYRPVAWSGPFEVLERS